jgi:predicted RNA-binding Zn-ribbon protein involved in translation (DUF1610 family)
VNRKQRRAVAKLERKQGNKDMAEKIALFDKLPDKCLACQGSFDKTDKEMVSSWNVVVRKSEGTVNLYCPDCWTGAQKIIENTIKELKERAEK